MTTKAFSLGAVLSITTGRLLCPYTEVRVLLVHMTDASRHQQFARALERCRPWLLHWFPALGTVDVAPLDALRVLHGPEEGCQAFVASLVHRGAPASYDVPPIPTDTEPPHAH